MNPIVLRLSQAVAAVRNDPSAQEILVQTLSALTASFRGLSPSDDDIFDLSEDGPSSEEKTAAINLAREDPRMVNLRSRIEEAVKGVVEVWNGDGEVADVSREAFIAVLTKGDFFPCQTFYNSIR